MFEDFTFFEAEMSNVERPRLPDGQGMSRGMQLQRINGFWLQRIQDSFIVEFRY
jgi:hypothetical protein